MGAPDIERLSRDEMTALQSRRLVEAVAYMDDRVPHYRKTLDAAGITPRDITSVDDLPALPFTVKADIAGHYPEGLRAVPMDDVVRMHASSGTTGQPVQVFYTRTDLARWIDCVARLLSIAGVGPTDVCQIAFKYTLFTGAFGHHRGAEHLGAAVLPTSAGQTERQVALLRDLGTTVLHATPSYAVVIAEALEALEIDPLDLPLRLGIHGAEPMSDELRDELQTRLGIRVARDYGLTELGGPGVSAECPAQAGYHINEDFFYPEIVDPESGRRLPEGQLGELVFTTLAKEASPVLRYRTRDLTTLTTEPCPCGRTLARHGPIRGRTDDMLIVGGVNFFPSQVESTLLAFEELRPHYEIRLRTEKRRDRVRVRVEASPGFWAARSQAAIADLSDRIGHALRDAVGFSMNIELLEPGALPRSEGKSKRVSDDR